MPIETLDPSNSVLFLGSGFSAGATNIANDKVPTGDPLAKRLAKALDDDEIEMDLKAAADEFAVRNDGSLYDLLYSTFTLSALLPHQTAILSLPWARIYTTNYDDAVNLAKGSSFPIFTFDEPRPRQLPSAFAIHLHGSIRRANENNADDQLILNSRSYDIISRQYPQWFTEFQRDRRTFEACFFLGFSLRDHHISGLMTSGDESVKRTFFITRPDPKPSFVRRASDYGEVVPIGFDAFASLGKRLPKPDRPRDLRALQSFKFLGPNLDGKRLEDPTPIEIINLVTFGTFSQNRYFNTSTDDSYVTPRFQQIRETLIHLGDSRTVLIHAQLGNGKTIFTSILASKATNKGYACLIWRRAGRYLSQDLEIIAEHPRPLIIFDDYEAAIDNIERIASSVPAAKFVVTVRTGQQEVRFHEILEKLPGPMKRVSLNPFNGDDREHLLSLLKQAGAQAHGLEDSVRSARDIRDIVTNLYNHSEIRSKITSAIANAPPSLTEIIVIASLIKWVGTDVDDSYIQEITGRDVYAEIRSYHGISSDFLEARDDKIFMRSVFLAEYFLQRIFSAKSILDGCYNITTSSLRRKKDRSHRRLSAELMKLSTLMRFLKFHTDSDTSIHRHYARLANDKDANLEPLFWLQYSILMKKMGDMPKALMFLKSGYERASRIYGFKTYQLDTQALSMYLLDAIKARSASVEQFEQIINSMKIVSEMIADPSHRHHAIEVIDEIPEFIKICRINMTDSEKISLVFELNRISQSLNRLTTEEKIYSGSEKIRERLEAGIVLLVAPTATQSN